MTESSNATSERGGLLANIMHFARVLRAAGLPIGPGTVLDAVNAVRAVGICDREDFYWTLHAVFVSRQDQRELFDQAFHVFWRDPRLLAQMLSLVLPQLRSDGGGQDDKAKLRRRLAEALDRGDHGHEPRDAAIHHAAMTWSDREILRQMDFEQMSQAEIAAAYRAGGYGYGHAKKELTGMISDYFAEARERRHDLLTHPDYVRDVLREGGRRGREKAEAFMERVREATGLLTTYGRMDV